MRDDKATAKYELDVDRSRDTARARFDAINKMPITAPGVLLAKTMTRTDAAQATLKFEIINNEYLENVDSTLVSSVTVFINQK
ncbi:hypothetical protein Pmar_PMAR018407 [Perkinsus marinus ATCC 50983]|uniref:Uncharacterized protein n=1 Tax=Perkinsus marinus (strain ATCC 50983 / TXsc) TaxID=423536 RepID=C5LJF1_PERM5|nr:hypothetical protein Pmar_PMAR018407 [Perkinsus marinus ATCC 50983]EER03151.1 hypothetical protein Pmar_PMAR018407 [Perkinsus marinus ATCC 50983]|eukprot:XP_002771335.1 hypothetical protein Pmar_PMAR018407 [Perkinsus marinus ATCC 50983]